MRIIRVKDFERRNKEEQREVWLGRRKARPGLSVMQLFKEWIQEAIWGDVAYPLDFERREAKIYDGKEPDNVRTAEAPWTGKWFTERFYAKHISDDGLCRGAKIWRSTSRAL